MEEKKKNPGFQKGRSGNENGRPKTGVGKPISRLRSTLNKLKGLEPDAVDIIEKVIKGQKQELNEDGEVVGVIAKEQVDTAKWVITMINTLTRGAIAEESYKLDLRESKENSQEGRANGTTGSAPKRFSLTMVSDEE